MFYDLSPFLQRECRALRGFKRKNNLTASSSGLITFTYSTDTTTRVRTQGLHTHYLTNDSLTVDKPSSMAATQVSYFLCNYTDKRKVKGDMRQVKCK